jgi:hypothetical protein
MLTLLSAIVAVGCILATARRLAWAVAPTALDAAVLSEELRARGEGTAKALRDAALARPELGWDHDVFEALAASDPAARDALVDEQLLELDWLVRRWSRVPRVCASIATSAGFFFASIALVRGLAAPDADVNGSLLSALDALAVGIAATSFCAAVHLRTRRLPAARLAAAEALIEKLRSTAQGRS